MPRRSIAPNSGPLYRLLVKHPGQPSIAWSPRICHYCPNEVVKTDYPTVIAPLGLKHMQDELQRFTTEQNWVAVPVSPISSGLLLY